MATATQVVYGCQKDITTVVNDLAHKDQTALTEADHVVLSEVVDFPVSALYVAVYGNSNMYLIRTRDIFDNDVDWAIKGQGSTPVDLVIPVPPKAIVAVTDADGNSLAGSGGQLALSYVHVIALGG